MINNNFLYELGFGLRTREDTLFIFRTMYEKLVKEGLNDTTLGNIEYIRKELDKHREYISNKTLPIIPKAVKAFLLIFNLLDNNVWPIE